MWLKWLPWKLVVSRLARSSGFLDPIAVLSYVRRFSQPSEVQEPIELLRAGVILHARGLMNSRSIQHNLDWIWPYWVERQFNPYDESFVPRAFSLTHINLTHRNWTAVGIPECPLLPIVDPRGLVTPLQDMWSVDAWIVGGNGEALYPSKEKDAKQRLVFTPNAEVHTETSREGQRLDVRTFTSLDANHPQCETVIRAASESGGWLVVSLRPYNPEGVSFLHRVELDSGRMRWRIEDWPEVRFSEAAERHFVSEYHHGDVARTLPDGKESQSVVCNVGMATVAAAWRIDPGQTREIRYTVPLESDHHKRVVVNTSVNSEWEESLQGTARLDVPDEEVQFIYDAAVRNLVLHSPDDVYPGPYTYKRFWFRDSAFIVHAMLCAGLMKRSKRALDRFLPRQTAFGYFHSQEGEWDSNGEALWIFRRYCELTNTPPPAKWVHAIKKGARWIAQKRTSPGEDVPHAGLLPAGFSAEHLGPIDFYYWDDFWGVAGFNAAAAMLREAGQEDEAARCESDSADFMADIERSLKKLENRIGSKAMPASPYRRLDSGAVGSIVAGYPLMLWQPDDPRLVDSAKYLADECTVNGGFFQDMIHSGINAYLTLHLAQLFMRAGDPRAFDLWRAVTKAASPTGQWPEAIHPRTGGGCMGDGQHIWAACEYVMMVRNAFVYEEPFGPRLVLGAGIMPEWLEKGGEISFGPAPTSWGPLHVRVNQHEDGLHVAWEAQWFDECPSITVRVPGFDPVDVDSGSNEVTLGRSTAGANA